MNGNATFRAHFLALFTVVALVTTMVHAQRGVIFDGDPPPPAAPPEISGWIENAHIKFLPVVGERITGAMGDVSVRNASGTAVLWRNDDIVDDGPVSHSGPSPVPDTEDLAYGRVTLNPSVQYRVSFSGTGGSTLLDSVHLWMPYSGKSVKWDRVEIRTPDPLGIGRLWMRFKYSAPEHDTDLNHYDANLFVYFEPDMFPGLELEMHDYEVKQESGVITNMPLLPMPMNGTWIVRLYDGTGSFVQDEYYYGD